MKHLNLLLLVLAASIFVGCEKEKPERIENPEISFKYREVERNEQETRLNVGQYKVEFENTSGQGLKAYMWRFDGDMSHDAAPATSTETFKHYFIDKGARKVTMTVQDENDYLYVAEFTIDIKGTADSIWIARSNQN